MSSGKNSHSHSSVHTLVVVDVHRHTTNAFTMPHVEVTVAAPEKGAGRGSGARKVWVQESWLLCDGGPMPKDAPAYACEPDGTCTVTAQPLAGVTATVRSLWNPYLKSHKLDLQTTLDARAKVCKRPRADDADGDADGGKARRGANKDAHATGSEAGNTTVHEDGSTTRSSSCLTGWDRGQSLALPT
jgi:hypothetical protein